MYLVSSYESDGYNVWDSDDNTEAFISKEDALNLLERGVFIYGLTKLSISYDLRVKVLFRLYSKKYCREYDGHSFRDYVPSNEIDTFTQVIDQKDEFSCVRSERNFWKIVEILKKINDYKVSSPMTLGYKIDSMDESGLILKDLATGSLFGDCTFSVCEYIVSEENLAIGGVYVEDGVMTFQVNGLDCKMTLDDEIREYFHGSYKDFPCEPKNEGVVFVPDMDRLESTWKDIDALFQNTDTIFLEHTPMCSIKECVERTGHSYGHSLWFNHGRATGLKNTGVVMEDGHLMVGKELVNCMDLLDFLSDDIKQGARQIAAGQDAKSLAVNGESFYGSKNYRVQINYPVSYGNFGLGMGGSSGGTNYKTVYGCINRNFKYTYNAIWLVRYANLGSLWYDLVHQHMVFGTMSQYRLYNGLQNDEFIDMTNKAVMNGYAWYYGMILPVCLSRLKVDKNGIRLYVTCLVAKTPEGFTETGTGVVELPLLFCRGKFLEHTDCYEYKMLLEDVVFEKSVIHNLWGTYTAPFNNSEVFEMNTKGKKALESLKLHQKYTVRYLEKVHSE